MSRPLIRFNLSLMAIGAMAALVLPFFSEQVFSLLGSLSFLWLVVAIAIAALLTSVEVFDVPANLLLGALVFVLVYQESSTFRGLYNSGWIVFVLVFLILVAAFMKRPRYVE